MTNLAGEVSFTFFIVITCRSLKIDDYHCDSMVKIGRVADIKYKNRAFRFVLCSTYIIFASWKEMNPKTKTI